MCLWINKGKYSNGQPNIYKFERIQFEINLKILRPETVATDDIEIVDLIIREAGNKSNFPARRDI